MQRLIGLMLGAELVGAALHSATPDRVEAQTPPRRVQLYIDYIYVNDDADDLTAGELTYRFRLQRGSVSCAGFWCTEVQAAGNEFIREHSVSASTGDMVRLQRTLGGPQGMALYPGDQVRVSFAGAEEDWNGPVIVFCPPRLPSQFDDTMCGTHDALGVAHAAFSEPTFGIGPHSKTAWNDGRPTFTGHYQMQDPASALPRPGTPRPSTEPTPRPTSRPGMPPRYEP